MDSGNGRFAELSEKKAKELESALMPAIQKGSLKGSGIFRFGEDVELKGSKFKVTNISAHKLTLTLQAN